MALWQRLSETQIAELFDPPAQQRELIRHFTLAAADLAAILRCRGDSNRLGYGLMLCYLNYPSRALRAGERPPTELIDFVAEQIGVLPGSIDEYLAAKRNCWSHSIECQRRLGLRSFAKKTAAELAELLLPQALENDRLAYLAPLAIEACRQRQIIVPSAAAIERHCAELRVVARREAYRRLTGGLSAEHRRGLDALTQLREETNLSWLAWLRQMPEAATPTAMLDLIDRLKHIRRIGIEPGRGDLIHQARLAQLVREAGRTTVQHIAGYERPRRHATLVAVGLDLCAGLTDQAIDMFDRLIGAMFRKAEGRHARTFQGDAKAINEKVRLYARVGAALIAAHETEQDAFGAIATVIPWERFLSSVAEAEALARPEEFDAYQALGERHAGVRRWSPAFLETFAFESIPASASLMRAIETLREMNRDGKSTLPKSAPTGFIRQRWARHVLPGGVIDRRYYELCVLSELPAILNGRTGLDFFVFAESFF